MAAFHDSTFQGLRLVCRLRQTPQAQAQASPAQSPQADGEASSTSGESSAGAADGEDTSTAKSEASSTPTKADVKTKDRFFIVKSLTVEDLELSVRNRLWATQSHNEDALNKAYKTSKNVYLIFSANKSGEYFGYARMASEIEDVPASELRSEGPDYQTTDLPRSTPTAATDSAPAGRVIDDSFRGTIFWEVVDEDDDDDESPSRKSSASDSTSSVSAWTRAFKVEWMSTNRVPFFRVRGMRNPWNSNREVKIARDGTEIEPSVGRNLIAVFHQPVMSSGMMHQGMDGMMSGGGATSGAPPAMHANLYSSSG